MIKRTDFIEACRTVKLSKVKKFLSHESFMSAIDKNTRYRAFNDALDTRNFKLIKMLVDDGRIFNNSHDVHGLTRLIDNYDFKIFKYIIENTDIDVNKNSHELYLYAAHFNRVEAFNLLLPRIDNINSLIQSCSHAIQQKSYDILNIILKREDLTPNIMYTLVSTSCISADIDTMNKCIDKANELNIEIDYDEIYVAACRTMNPKALEFILSDSRFNSINKYGKGLLAACDYGCINNISLLMSHDEIIDTIPELEMNKAFHICCLNYPVDIVKNFLNRDNVNPTFNNGQCLESATYARKWDVVTLLIEDGRLSDTIIYRGNRIFDLLLNRNKIDIIKLLLKNSKIVSVLKKHIILQLQEHRLLPTYKSRKISKV